MRLTPYLNSDLHFGSLAKIHNIVIYKISPFEQRAFAGAIKHGVPNILRRIRSNIFYVAPPILLGFVVYNLAEAEHHHLSRKNPADFENDE